jgi:hypothetical protein
MKFRDLGQPAFQISERSITRVLGQWILRNQVLRRADTLAMASAYSLRSDSTKPGGAR